MVITCHHFGYTKGALVSVQGCQNAYECLGKDIWLSNSLVRMCSSIFYVRQASAYLMVEAVRNCPLKSL